jgi:hypothetical protein
MELYKLTNKNGCTQGNTQWGIGVTHELKATEKPRLCTKDVLHAYKNINLALLLNPNHANISNPKIWEAEGKIVVEDYGKVGCFKLTTTKELSCPDWYIDDKKRRRVQVQFAVLCAESVLHIYENQYPDDNRPRKAIEAAQNYLKKPSNAAAKAANAAAKAANAAYAAKATKAAYAAYAAAYAAKAAYEAYEAYAAYAAYEAANAVAYAAKAANVEIDFCALADQAVKMEDNN